MATRKKKVVSVRRQKLKVAPKRVKKPTGPKSFRVAARTILHLGRELITSDEIAINELIKNAFDAGSPNADVTIVCPIPPAEVASLIEMVRDSSETLANVRKGVIVELNNAIEERDLKKVAVDHFDGCIEEIGRARSDDAIVDILERLNYLQVSDAGHGMASSTIVPVFLTVGTDNKVLNPISPDGTERLGNKGIGRLAMMRLGDRAKVTTWIEGSSRATAVEFDWRQFDNADLQVSDIPIATSRLKIPGESASGTQVRVFPLKSDWTESNEQLGGLKSFIRRLRSPFSAVRKFKIRVSVNGSRPIPTPPLHDSMRGHADQVLELRFDPKGVLSLTDPLLWMKLTTGEDVDSAEEQPRSASAVLRILTDTDGARKKAKKHAVAVNDQATPIDLHTLKAIGPFKLHILRFNRRQLREKVKQDWDLVRRELDMWSGGIAIYRDGFRVGFTGSDKDGDWLGLDAKALRGSGYVVNRIQVMGALEITHRGNPNLRDLTNREGLISTPEVEALKELLIRVAINPLRALVQMEDQKTRQQDLERLVSDGTSTLADRLTLAKQDIASLRTSAPEPLKRAISSLDSHLHFISAQVTKFESAVEKAGEGREEILELAGVGNVMHGVMHELTRTTAQTRELIRKISGRADKDTQELLDKLEQEIKAINVRLRQMDPLMPGARHVKKDIDVERLVRTIASGYETRFARHEISLVIEKPENSEAFLVNMVPGFLSLALENLISNSVYWLAERDDKTVSAKITIDIDPGSNTVSVTDNGPGVKLSDRERVFHPGFSLRAKGKGYGLYLAREVAEYHQGRLYLDASVGDCGGLNTFVLELPRKQ
ncbi:ATP-binding protein [Stenotrophomonas indicatrix]|uniref:sensor histidine kinase n=1 Tax=Stenotrophomonas indicatrix TaxID=2045451 RepID=UPI00300834DC